MNAFQLRRQVEPTLLGRPDVTGVGNVGNKLRIYVEGTPVFPRWIDNIEVEVFKTGKIHALHLLNSVYVEPWANEAWSYQEPRILPKESLYPERTQIFRPIPGGVSIGHPSITAGTNGTSLAFIGLNSGLSNNHVLAAGSSYEYINARIGDPTYQPGPHDGGGPSDEVGNLIWYMPMSETGVNLIDAALFQPSTPDLLSDEILEIGVPRGVANAQLNEIVKKSGRTTGLTYAPVLDVNASVKVNYGNFEAVFENQIITDNMADGGDSGSALLSETDMLVGLLFAGSNFITVHNNIRNVIAAIGGKTEPRPAAKSPFPFVIPPLVGTFMTGLLG